MMLRTAILCRNCSKLIRKYHLSTLTVSGRSTNSSIEFNRPIHASFRPIRALCTVAEKKDDDYHSIISNKERGKGHQVKQEFQAETRKLLDIVAKSLYSEKEVFVRELISNSSDALEKLRYLLASGGEEIISPEVPLEIHLKTDEQKKTFTIQDTGLGMNYDEMVKNLGTIARSGSKDFISQVSGKEAEVGNNIIGQFGVGFYASFMVAEKVDVYSRSYRPEEIGHKWSSDGLGTYEIGEAESVDRGTKIVLHLRGDSYDYAKEEIIDAVIKKYSNFVGVPIFLNGKRVNVIEPLWLRDTSKIEPEEHEEFYRFISKFYGQPRYTITYKTDAPINIRTLLYVPDHKPSMLDMSRESETGVALYSRKVMVLNNATALLPKWLRFLKGVVDSEDVPLNLSRELLQNSVLIRKLNQVLTSRVIKYFSDQSKKDPEGYRKFYEDYGLFMKEGIVTTGDVSVREDIAKLLRFESSNMASGELTSLPEYASRMKAGSRTIFFMSAPSRELAETSPYYEAVKRKLGEDVEILLLFEPYDELVLMQMQEFDKKQLRSIESEVVDDASDTSTVDADDPDSLSQEAADGLITWLETFLGARIKKAKITKRLTSHPCVISIRDLGAVRHFMRTSLADKSNDEKYRLMESTLEINPRHPIIRKLSIIKDSDPELAKMITQQLFDNSLTAAGLMEDPRAMVSRINDLLARALEKW